MYRARLACVRPQVQSLDTCSHHPQEQVSNGKFYTSPLIKLQVKILLSKILETESVSDFEIFGIFAYSLRDILRIGWIQT